MAKTKTAKSRANRKVASSTKRSASTKPATVPIRHPRVFSDVEIGLVAGQVWLLLADEGSQTLTSLKKAVDAPESHVMAAIGWLARENKLLFGNDGRSTRLTLR